MKLTIPEQPTTVASPTGPVLVRKYQVVVPVRLVIAGQTSAEFPAILDTGHSHNFSLYSEHMRNWIGMSPRRIGTVKINKQVVPLVEADLKIDGAVVSMPDGIAVFAAQSPFAPRLPLLGLRSLVRNRIRIVIDGTSIIIG